VIISLTLTSKMTGTVMIYEEVAAWDYDWQVEDATGHVLKLTKLGEHYADKSPHKSVGRRPRKLAQGDSVTAQIDLNELVIFPGAGDYQVKFSRTLKPSDRPSCSVSAEPLRFHLEADNPPTLGLDRKADEPPKTVVLEATLQNVSKRDIIVYFQDL
jgi:hypothetical protein